MIRQVCIVCVAGLLFLAAAGNFYYKALRHDPLAEVSVKKAGLPEPEKALPAAYRPAWSPAIHEKNLFSPNRTYIEPKPVQPAQAVEPPKMPELVLKGVVLDSFNEYVAYIEIGKAKALPMRKGDKTENLELIDISGRKAVLKWNDEMITLNLDKIKTIDNPKGTK
ncbi:MAG: hypothetical protein ACYC69_10905 [Thermodesulfovibrionales bacterium]